MVFGLVSYVVYRKVFEGTTLTKRVSVPEQALTKQVPEVEFGNILVPVFGTKLDDDIVGTAGRLAAADAGDAEGRQRLAPRRRLRDRGAADRCRSTRRCRRSARSRRGGRWSGRARSGRSTRTSRSTTDVVRARKVGAGIVEEARRSNVEVIVIGGEPPTQIRGGASSAASAPRKPAEIGAGDRVRAEEGALPGAAHGAAGTRDELQQPRLVSGPCSF